MGDWNFSQWDPNQYVNLGNGKQQVLTYDTKQNQYVQNYVRATPTPEGHTPSIWDVFTGDYGSTNDRNQYINNVANASGYKGGNLDGGFAGTTTNGGSNGTGIASVTGGSTSLKALSKDLDDVNNGRGAPELWQPTKDFFTGKDLPKIPNPFDWWQWLMDHLGVVVLGGGAIAVLVLRK
jgi:hypothetical protein